MPRIEIHTNVAAPVERVFDIARSIDAHVASQTRHQERAVGGCLTGLIELGETVTWEAVHFGVRQRLSSQIGEMKRPHHFRDSMISGAFERFDHDHFFEQKGEGTRMIDLFDYTSPLGVMGILADRLFLKGYMRRLLIERAQIIRAICESNRWRQFL